MSAGCTTAAQIKPSVSTTMCRLRPLTFLPASYPRGPLFRWSGQTGCPAPPRSASAHALRLRGPVFAADRAAAPACRPSSSADSDRTHFPTAEIVGNHLPLAAGFQHVEQRVHDLHERVLPMRSAMAGRLLDHGAQELPLRCREIARVGFSAHGPSLCPYPSGFSRDSQDDISIACIDFGASLAGKHRSPAATEGP